MSGYYTVHNVKHVHFTEEIAATHLSVEAISPSKQPMTCGMIQCRYMKILLLDKLALQVFGIR